MLQLNFSTAQRRNRLLFLIAAAAISSCAGSHHYHDIAAEGPSSTTPRYLELRSEVSVATMHFPAGTYSLAGQDDVGYYYRALRKIAEHSAGAPIWHDGGIYLNKRDPRRLRGYIYWAGKLTHVGNLSQARHYLHD